MPAQLEISDLSVVAADLMAAVGHAVSNPCLLSFFTVLCHLADENPWFYSFFEPVEEASCTNKPGRA